ncbi:DUF1850 domain-containing protein [Mesorhizobium microcysteis]|uniref:DUF1850 domain-containing protein n=1 Tax=Neoaquamicrobium microcysteis TaxID=2682781 RepID=A0A5D4GYJ1_9HYPH|nr:DUF1850 domain-containing protein [Mesorhizobium microcysteis]TYR33112.1 DUF1850 domain-containing protein [Mesorhizobium microcysteis]
MSLCIAAGGKAIVLAANLFTLSWQHSVERTEWREAWRITPAGLELVEARVKGSGAGIDPPEGATLIEGWWVWKPALPAQPRLVLAASGATASGWSVCVGDECVKLGDRAGEPVTLEPCPNGKSD